MDEAWQSTQVAVASRGLTAMLLQVPQSASSGPWWPVHALLAVDNKWLLAAPAWTRQTQLQR